MKSNLGLYTRITRTSIGALIIILYLTDVLNGTLALILLGIATMLLITSAISFCPAASICPIRRFYMHFGKE